MTAPHGTSARYAAGCREACCRAAWAATRRYRHRQIAYGRWQPYVDATPVRARIEDLLAAGATMLGIAEMTGVNRATLIKALRPIGDRPASRRVRPGVAAAVLAVTVESFDPGTPSDPADEVAWLVRSGRSVDEVAAARGITVKRVREIVAEKAQEASTRAAHEQPGRRAS